MYRRSARGSLVPFLLILACFGLMIVFGLIAVELLVKWVTLGRIQAATQAGALAYARELVKIRDNEMGETQNPNLRFQNTQRARACTANVANPASLKRAEQGVTLGNGYTGCTAIDTQAINVKSNSSGGGFSEFVTASQVMLYQLKNPARNNIQDASAVRDLTMMQCYNPANQTRFNKIGRPPACSGGIGDVLSPLTDLTWGFIAAPYGQGACQRQSASGQGGENGIRNQDKDFCVEAHVMGRLDPIIAGGLPFLAGRGIFANDPDTGPIDFIVRGDFHLAARAIVLLPNFEIHTGNLTRQGKDEYYDDVKNYSADTIGLENCTSLGGSGCGN
jgi:hypothetical protein